MNRKKTAAIMLVMMPVVVVCLFADNSNEVNGVYIFYSKSSGNGTIHNNRSLLNGKPAVTVFYTIYYEDGGQKSDNAFCPDGNGSTKKFYIENRMVKSIIITKVEVFANQR